MVIKNSANSINNKRIFVHKRKYKSKDKLQFYKLFENVNKSHDE